MRSPCLCLCLCLCHPLGTDNLLAKRRRATYGGTRRWPRGCPIGLRMQPRNEKFFPFAGKARTPSSAPPFSRRSSRHASAGRSSPNGRQPSFTATVAQIGRHLGERPHATPAGSPRSWPGCPAAPTRSSSRAPPTSANCPVPNKSACHLRDLGGPYQLFLAINPARRRFSPVSEVGDAGCPGRFTTPVSRTRLAGLSSRIRVPLAGPPCRSGRHVTSGWPGRRCAARATRG